MEHLYFPLLSPYQPPNSFDFNASNNHHFAKYNSRYHTSIASCPPSPLPPSNHQISPNKQKTPYFEMIGPFAPLGAPIWNPFWNLREMVLSVRIRPVPVVFLRLAFIPQLSTGSVRSVHTRWRNVERESGREVH